MPEKLSARPELLLINIPVMGTGVTTMINLQSLRHAVAQLQADMQSGAVSPWEVEQRLVSRGTFITGWQPPMNEN